MKQHVLGARGGEGGVPVATERENNQLLTMSKKRSCVCAFEFGVLVLFLKNESRYYCANALLLFLLFAVLLLEPCVQLISSTRRNEARHGFDLRDSFHADFYYGGP